MVFAIIGLYLANALMISILIWMAFSVLNTEESIETPWSVKTIGLTLLCFRKDNRSQIVTSSFFMTFPTLSA
jgi:hypothetical protein